MPPNEHQTTIEDLLGQARGPMSADEIRLELGTRNISQATIYRILKKATENGTFKEVCFPDGPKRYELSGHDHHHHFICTQCDRAFDIKGCPEQIYSIAPKEFKITDHDLLLKGLCPACQA